MRAFSCTAARMLAALAATVALAPPVDAQDPAAERYVVWSSVVFTRTGERTPEVLGKIPPQLTSAGAQQAYAAGRFFRNRYLGTPNGTNGGESAGAELIGLSGRYDQLQTVSLALEQQYNVATQQAFLQGLYPPSLPGANDTTAGAVGPSSLDANNTYIPAPLDGYQYPRIRSAGPLDPAFVRLSGNLNCPTWSAATQEARDTPQSEETQDFFNGLYDAIGSATLIGTLNQSFWDYNNAYAIYDYLRYQNVYNATIRDTLAGFRYTGRNVSFLDQLRWLADEQQWGQLGNISARNVATGQLTLAGSAGSISTIAGNTFAAQVLESLSSAIELSVYGQKKLNLFFADYHPLTSFFALAGLPNLNAHFYGTPDFASSAVFELFSKTNATDPAFPAEDDLWVKFYFRNGTDPAATTANDDGNTYQAYPLFNRGPHLTDMMWSDFRYEMENRMLAGVGDWCNECRSQSYFCAAFDPDGNAVAASSRRTPERRRGDLSPAVAGVVGAIVALGVAGVLFGLAMLVAGLRVHRRPSRPSDLGGFKGGSKMRSDQDLALPKGGAVVGASVVDQGHAGHERHGSWELKNAEAGRNWGGLSPEVTSGRPSMEEMRQDPLADPEGLKPTQTHEHV